jgi:uncharacterized FAD-dependent dehydrogenase
LSTVFVYFLYKTFYVKLASSGERWYHNHNQSIQRKIQMIKLSNIKVPAAKGDTGLTKAAADLLGIPPAAIRSMSILKRSVDARHKGDVCFTYTVALSADDEAGLLQAKGGIASPYTPPEDYAFPFSGLKAANKPVIVGAGPAGLFAALCLAQAGLEPVLLERGKPVEERVADVARGRRGDIFRRQADDRCP